MYDDFLVLKDEDYLNIMQQYNEAKQLDKTGEISRVFVLLNACYNFCLAPIKFNAKILEALSRAKQNIKAALDNLKTSYNFESFKSGDIKQIGLFNFLLKLNMAGNYLLELSLKEGKVYNKKICTASIKLINSAIYDVLNELTKCDVRIYRFL